MDYEAKHLHARINALEVALVAAVKKDAAVMQAVRDALDEQHDLAVNKRDAPTPAGFLRSVLTDARVPVDADADQFRVATLDALRNKFV